MLTGFAFGGLLAPVLGIFVIPTVGWQASLWIAAVLLPVLPLMYRVVPESLSVLLRKGPHRRCTCGAAVNRPAA